VKPSASDKPPQLEGSYLRTWLGLTLSLLALCYLLNMVMGIPRAGLPRVLAHHVGATAAMTALADLLFFGIGKCMTDLVAGWMTDAAPGGRKGVLLIGGSLTCAGCVAIWLAVPGGVDTAKLELLAKSRRPDVDWHPFLLISLGQFLNGLGSGFQNQGIMTAMQDLGGSSRRGLAGGLMEAALYYGVTTGNFLGGWLVHLSGQVLFPFLVMAVIAAACTFAAGLWTVDTRRMILAPAGYRFVRPGWAAYRMALTHRSLWVIYFAGLMSKWVDSMIFVMSSLYLKALGYSILQSAVIQTGFVLAWSTLSLFTGALSDLIGRKPLVWLGMLWNGVFTLVFLYLSRPGDIAWEVFLTVLLGCGTGFYYGLPPAIAADVAPVEWRGVAISVYRFWRDFGHIVSTLVFFAIYRSYGETILAAEWILWVSAALLFAGAAIALLFMKETHPGARPGLEDSRIKASPASISRSGGPGSP
jgi:MFS family permease